MNKRLEILMTVLLAVLVSSCHQEAPLRDCDAKALLLDKDYLLLDRFVVSDYYFESPSSQAPPESASYSFYINNDVVGNSVFRYKYIDQAIDFYKSRERNEFRATEAEGPWEWSEGMPSVEIHAQQYSLGCGNFYSERRCNFIARYDEYYVSFQAAISEQGLSVQDFGRGVNQIDSQIVACINK